MSASNNAQITPYISREQIALRIQEMAKKINADYTGQEIVALCTLKGSVLFFADIVRELKIPLRFEFLGTSSYGHGTTSSGEVKVTLDLNSPISDQHVIVFEDIVDSGLTLSFVLDYLRARKPASIKTATLLFKPTALKKPIKPDYVGFEIPNDFVIGYGMDYAEKYREMPYIGVLKP